MNKGPSKPPSGFLLVHKYNFTFLTIINKCRKVNPGHPAGLTSRLEHEPQLFAHHLGYRVCVANR